jgi:hypothetical protein
MRNAILKLSAVCGLLGALASGLAAQSATAADERWTSLVDGYLDKVYVNCRMRCCAMPALWWESNCTREK